MWKSIMALFLIVGCVAFVSTEVPAKSETLTINLESLQKESWSEKELANVKLIADFVQNLMNNHNFEYVLEKYNDDRHIQHNRNLPDKIEGLAGFLKEFVQDYPDYTYDVKHIYADGDYVIFHSHATLKAEDRGNDQKGMNIIDTWRIENGKIVEHWDSIQALDTLLRFNFWINGGKIRNKNGVF